MGIGDTNIWPDGFQLIGSGNFKSTNGQYFVGFNDTHNFGVYKSDGTPVNIIVENADNAAMGLNGLVVTNNQTAGVSTIMWQSPTSAPGDIVYGYIGDDGSFSIYTGAIPPSPDRCLWSVALPQVSSDVTVVNGTTGQFSFAVMWDGGPSAQVHVDGSAGATGSITVSGVAGQSCYLQYFSPLGGSPHNSGDNFSMGDQGVSYSLGFSINPFDPPSWNRTH